MERERLMLIVTDIHLKSSNYKKITELFSDAIAKAVELDVPLVCLGDFFDSRSSQRLDVLLAAKEIFNKVSDAGLEMLIIPGNHDKTLYESHNSFLDIYDIYEGIRLIRDVEVMTMKGKSLTLMPFFIESMMVERLDEMESSDILLSHFELNGSVNHGIKAKDRAIVPSMLDKFDFVGLGHYHNGHDIEGTNVHHFSSIMQNNYGEDEDKGFHLLYTDYSHELIKSNFKPFKTVSMNLDTMTKDDEKEVLKMAKNDKINLRLEVTGSEEKMRAFKKDKFVLAGVDVKRKYKEVKLEDLENGESKDNDSNDVDVEQEFVVFCEKENLDIEKGKVYL